MAKPKHTPGPWRYDLEIERQLGVADRHQWRIYTEVPLRRSRFVAEVPSHSQGPREADARLIAAAPAMLEALNELSGLLWGWRDEEAKTEAEVERYEDAARIVESALAAARGEGLL